MRELLIRYRPTILHWSMEVVVVVIGVLLALSVQQWAEDRSARLQAKECRGAHRAANSHLRASTSSNGSLSMGA